MALKSYPVTAYSIPCSQGIITHSDAVCEKGLHQNRFFKNRFRELQGGLPVVHACYLCVGGAAGAAGCVFTGALFTPCNTDFGPLCLMALIESVTEVSMKSTAQTVVALERPVAAPRGPNAAWLP